MRILAEIRGASRRHLQVIQRIKAVLAISKRLIVIGAQCRRRRSGIICRCFVRFFVHSIKIRIVLCVVAMLTMHVRMLKRIRMLLIMLMIVAY